MIEDHSVKHLILDMQKMSFMDSSGIAVVINAMRTIKHFSGELFISGLREQPMKVIRLSGIDRLVRIKEEVS